MAAPPVSGHAVWIGKPGVFAMAHVPVDPKPTGVLVCSPFGWEDMASYPARRDWAVSLQDAGYAAVRFDWPGTGDAAGTPSDPDRLSSWCAALEDVGTWLRQEAGAERLAVIGLGLGGLIAFEALRRGTPIDDLVLWGAAGRGRAFVRGERAFARLQTDRLGPGEDDALPEGWLESGGYVLSADTLAELSALDPAAASSLDRALLLDKDGLPVDERLATGLRAGGTDVELAPGTGYGEMIASPQQCVTPSPVIDQVTAWLARAPAAGAPATAPRVFAGGELELDGAHERAFTVTTAHDQLFCVLTEPEEPKPGAPTLVLLPAWGERRAGPNRLWTEAARDAAARGIRSLRVDLPGIGDSTGDRGWLHYASNVHDPQHVMNVRAVLDALEAEGLGSRFLLCGLCSGGFWSLRAQDEDPRVCGALVVNTELAWHDPALQMRQDAYKVRRVLQWQWWRRVASGEVKLASVWAQAQAAIAVAGLRAKRRLRRQADPTPSSLALLEAVFDRVAQRGGRLSFGLTGNEPLLAQMRATGVVDRLDRWPGVQIRQLRSQDHNVRPLPAQQDVHRLLSELLDASS